MYDTQLENEPAISRLTSDPGYLPEFRKQFAKLADAAQELDSIEIWNDPPATLQSKPEWKRTCRDAARLARAARVKLVALAHQVRILNDMIEATRLDEINEAIERSL